MNHLRAAWRGAVLQREGIAARSGIEVYDLHPTSRPEAGSTTWGGTVRSGTGYRGFGSWGELKDAVRNGRWASAGTFVIRGEGQTQFASSLEAVLKGSGMHSLRGSGFLGAIEADLSGLPWRTFIQAISYDPGDAGGFRRQRGEKPGGYLWMPEEGATEGLIWPDLGLGLGIDGGVPIDQLTRVYEIEDKKVVRSWPFREWEDRLESLQDNPEWTPEVRGKPETTRSWVGWIEYQESESSIVALPKSNPLFHRLDDRQDKGDCGFKLYEETTKAQNRIFGKDSWMDSRSRNVREGKSRVPEQWIKDASMSGILKIDGYRNRTQIKAKPCPKCWPRYR